jgi:signal peptidase I
MDQTSSPPAVVAKPSVEGSVKETIESILVAFMLAFIFRAFVVEAFVIPTGSMAPTLLGAHMRFRCPDCGYRFDVNYSGADNGTDDIAIPKSAGPNRVYSIFCPNCGYRLPREDPSDYANDATDPEVNYGDRILVLKYLYLFQQPTRWDVVVFKSPYAPAQYDYTVNYIKRLVGKPGESVMVLDGDVYIGKGTDLTTFKVQTKPYKAQEALWRLVYDNDYYPRPDVPRTITDPYGNVVDNDPPFQQPWKQLDGDSGWQIGSGAPGQRDFQFVNPTGSATLAFDPTANPKKFALTDWLAYDITDSQGALDGDTYNANTTTTLYNVSDLKLSFFYQRNSGDGVVRIQMSKLQHMFETQISPTSVTLLMDDKPIAGPAPLPKKSGVQHIEMINADYHVSVRIDDQEILATTPEQYYPDVQKLMDDYRANAKPQVKPIVRIVAADQSSVVSHLILWRDVYYLNRDHYDHPLNWASPENFPRHLTQLGPDEYFVMGDNSSVSLDARYWNDPIDLDHENLHVDAGRVPQRFMLGKAFFVYWPAGYRPVDSAPALVPNFGDMRFIH